jgi:hypothetical protein
VSHEAILPGPHGIEVGGAAAWPSIQRIAPPSLTGLTAWQPPSTGTSAMPARARPGGQELRLDLGARVVEARGQGRTLRPAAVADGEGELRVDELVHAIAVEEAVGATTDRAGRVPGIAWSPPPSVLSVASAHCRQLIVRFGSIMPSPRGDPVDVRDREAGSAVRMGTALAAPPARPRTSCRRRCRAPRPGRAWSERMVRIVRAAVTEAPPRRRPAGGSGRPAPRRGRCLGDHASATAEDDVAAQRLDQRACRRARDPTIAEPTGERERVDQVDSHVARPLLDGPMTSMRLARVLVHQLLDAVHRGAGQDEEVLRIETVVVARIEFAQRALLMCLGASRELPEARRARLEEDALAAGALRHSPSVDDRLAFSARL